MRPRRRATVGTLSARWSARFKLLAKLLTCTNFASSDAVVMLDASSVTKAGFLSSQAPYIHHRLKQICNIWSSVADKHCSCLQNMGDNLPFWSNVEACKRHIWLCCSRCPCITCDGDSLCRGDGFFDFFFHIFVQLRQRCFCDEPTSGNYVVWLTLVEQLPESFVVHYAVRAQVLTNKA